MTKVNVRATGSRGATTTEAPSPAPERLDQASIRDVAGRTIEVRRIGAVDRYRLAKILGSEASQNPMAMGYAVLAFSVTNLAGSPVPQPQTERDIEILIERMGDDGLVAVSAAHSEQFGVTAPQEDDTAPLGL